MNQNNSENRTVEKDSKRSRKLARSIVDVLNGNVLAKDFVVSNLPFLFFLTAIIIVNIGYGYYSNDTASQIVNVQETLTKLKSEDRAIETELNNSSMQTEVAESAKSIGLMESMMPPIQMKVTKSDSLWRLLK